MRPGSPPGLQAAVGLLDSGLAEQFVVINYPLSGKSLPKGPDLLLLLSSRSSQEDPAWKKALFKPLFPEGDDALHQSQSSELSPVVGSWKFWWGETHREGGSG